MKKSIMNELNNLLRKSFTKKRLGGTKAIVIEVILVLLAVGAVLLFKEEIIDMVSIVITTCKKTITSIIS